MIERAVNIALGLLPNSPRHSASALELSKLDPYLRIAIGIGIDRTSVFDELMISDQMARESLRFREMVVVSKVRRARRQS